MKTPLQKRNARPAIYTLDGDVYTGLDAYTILLIKWMWLQISFRILSGFYTYKPLISMLSTTRNGTKLLQ
jgi:cytoplasmic iron level regulating protein YaaA (DUF328/UPF0246 family)